MPMNIQDFDKNFALPEMAEKDVCWYDANSYPFSLYGIYFDRETDRYRRMPEGVAKKVSNSVTYGANYTVGGRIKFATNSPYVAIKCSMPSDNILAHMPIFGSHSFSLYVDDKFTSCFYMENKDIEKAKPNALAFSRSIRFDEKEIKREISICFPLYNGVYKLFIGIKKGCELFPAKEYAYKKPIVFYGSSITQGGCASHPGNEYTALCSRWLDSDYINLGFSGGAKAETEMVNYLASIDASVFVLDYDHNAPTESHLRATYPRLIQTIRNSHPLTPILIITSPNSEFMYHGKERKEYIKSVYETAKENGDNNVYFIDGDTLFGNVDRDVCTVDCVHPNDLGFYRMAKTVYPVLNKILNK